MSQEEAFNKVIQDIHIPVSQNMGAATFWAPKSITPEIQLTDEHKQPLGPSTGANVPRPDRTIGTLSWLSPLLGLFGLDHFYLRSPKTGLAKLLTLGGFGLWWIWDWVQIWAEPERVKTFGLSAPFDLFHGIAQGMITDSTNYTPERDFGIWMIMNVFGFTGFALFYLGRYTQGMRMLVMFALMMYFFPYGGFFNAFHSIWGIFKFIFFILFASGVVYNYCNTLYYMFSDDLLNTGIPLSQAGNRMMNSETKPGEKGDKEDKASFIKKIYNFQSITGHDLILNFWIKSQFESVIEKPDLSTKLMDTWYAPFFYWGWIVFEGAVLTIASGCIAVARLAIPGYLAAERTAALAEKQIKLGEQQMDAARIQMSKAVSGLQEQATVLQSQATGALSGLQAQATGLQAPVTGFQAPITGPQSQTTGLQAPTTGLQAPTTGLQAQAMSALSGPQSQATNHMRGGANVFTKGQTGVFTKGQTDVSTEGQILGATVLALVAGGGLKALIDYMVSE